MSTNASLSALAKAIQLSVEDEKKRPRTLAERVLAISADLLLAVAFFALGFTANVLASKVVEPDVSKDVSNSAAFVAALLGLLVLKFWRLAHEYESVRNELKHLDHEFLVAAAIVEATVEALAKRQHASDGSSDRSGGDGGDAAPMSHAP